MKIRYFEIRAPRPDFTGKIGGVSFADGVAHVSFDDERDDDGRALGDEHRVQVGRSAVLFAQRRGYKVTEVKGPTTTPAAVPDTRDARIAELEAKLAALTAGETPNRAASKADWKAHAIKQGMPEAEAEAMTRDALAEKYLGPKEAS